jgi:ankyrin repeat protein
LISYGADVNGQDGTGKTPIFYATMNADVKIARLLLSNKANVKDNPELLSIAVKKECREIVEGLLQHGADVNTSDEYGRTALHFTALDEDREVYESRHPNDPGGIVKENIAKLLLSWGANVNAQTENGKTALHVANEQGYLTVVDVLLKFGVNIDCKDEDGRTALHTATKREHEDIFVALLEHGSDINIMDKDNRTPLNIAMNSVYSFDSYNSDDEYYDCHDSDTCEYIAETLEHHVVKMNTANLYVSNKNLRSIRNDDGIRDFQNKCEEEIARLKREKVGNTNVSFYGILTKGTNQLAMYARNESIVQVLRSGVYKRIFPIYASMISSNFRKGERRKVLLEQGNKVFHFLFNNFPQLPHDCTDKVLSYLSDEDLRILIDACKPVSIQQS